MTAILEKVTDNKDIATETGKEQNVLRNNDNLCSSLIKSSSNEKKNILKDFSLDLVREYTRAFLEKKENNVSRLANSLNCSRQHIYDFLKGERDNFEIIFVLNLLKEIDLALFLGKKLEDPPKKDVRKV